MFLQNCSEFPNAFVTKTYFYVRMVKVQIWLATILHLINLLLFVRLLCESLYVSRWYLATLRYSIRAAKWENRIFAYAKTKTQISFAVTAKLISVFVFATRIVKSLFFLNTKFQVSSHLQWLPSPVCVTHGQKPPRRPVFWRRGS